MPGLTWSFIPANMLLQVERHVRWVWRFLMMPLLFGLIGTSVTFSTLAKGTIPKAVGIVFAGVSDVG